MLVIQKLYNKYKANIVIDFLMIIQKNMILMLLEMFQRELLFQQTRVLVKEERMEVGKPLITMPYLLVVLKG